jgi:hypothetical protein
MNAHIESTDAGFYVYFRECFAGAERRSEPAARRADAAQPKLRDVA